MPSSSYSIGQQMLRTASIFQAIAALCTGLIQGNWVLELFFYPWKTYRSYDALTAITTTLLAVIILFSILVERNPNNTAISILIFEAVKSASASALWLWLLLDSLYGPDRYDSTNPHPEIRERRITLSWVSVLLLCVGFYPTLAFASFNYKKQQSALEIDEVDEEREGERQPLLRA